jgi:predicted acylesterase/phospholipase RssA
MDDSAEVRALVLSGGGAKGAYEVGLISKLMEFEEPFDIVCGTSIGALNAAMIAQHRIPELVEIWQKISVLDVMKPSPHVEPWHELFQRAMAAKNANWLAKGPKVLALLAYVLVHGHKLTSRSSLASITGVIDHLVTQSILEEYLDFSQLKSVLMTSACNLTLRREDAFYYFPPEYARFERTFLNQQAREHRKPIPYNPELFYEFVRASGAIPCAFTPVQLTTELDVLDDGKHTGLSLRRRRRHRQYADQLRHRCGRTRHHDRLRRPGFAVGTASGGQPCRDHAGLPLRDASANARSRLSNRAARERCQGRRRGERGAEASGALAQISSGTTAEREPDRLQR